MAEKKDLKQNETLEQNTKTEEIKTEPAYNKKTAVSIKQTIKISSPKPNPIYNILEDTKADSSTPQDIPFMDTVYEQIHSVLGGDNANQYLCLTIPGQALCASDYSYDYKDNVPKGPVVQANESRLANKLFDPCRITGSDNGLTLPYQYRSALDMLTPKLNSKIAQAKNQLRELLMTEYAYNFGEGDNKYTLQEVFFRLYDEWIAESQKWSELQNQKKEELRKKYPEGSAKNNDEYNKEYLEWYETVAESNLNAINEKMSKVISVFTPNDMKILEGILDSGSGAELEQARQTLTNIQKLTPDGGYIYPVSFVPTNWFELLNTAFTPIDLLKTPDALAMQMQSLSNRRLNLNSQLDNISAMIPDNDTINKAKANVDNAKNALNQAISDISQTYFNGFESVLNTILDIAPLFSGGAIPMNILSKLTNGIPLPEGKTLKDLSDSLKNALVNNISVQTEYIDASQNLADSMITAVEAHNLASLKNMILPLKSQLDNVNQQIEDLQTQIQLAAITQPYKINEDGTLTDNNTDKSAVAPSTVPEGYTQVLISASASTLDKQSSSVTSSSVSSSGGSFFFTGYSSKSNKASSLFNDFCQSGNSSIQIGMNVAKVGIEREWFNPGVFALTKDMFNVTTSKISPNPTQPYTSITDDRLKEMATGGYVFPCYPVAMVIARDITIKMVCESGMNQEFANSVEEHASHGGGFLFFSGSSSSSSSSSSSGVHSTSTSNSITLKFDTPQIIGYYMQATTADKSTYLDDVTDDYKAGYVTISKFVEDYKQMLKAKNSQINNN